MTERERIQHETEVIKQVIGDATDAVTHRDLRAYPNGWVHAPYARRSHSWSHASGNWSEGGLLVQEGWENIWAWIRSFFEEAPWAAYPHGTLRQNWNLRVGKEIAWATYDQYPLDAAGQPAPQTVGFTHETRMLEKHSGKWKFTYMSYLHEIPSQTSQALVRVSEDAIISGMTTAAAERLANSEALQVRSGRLRAIDADTDSQLRSLIRRTALANPWTTGLLRVPLLLKTPWGSSDCVCWILSSTDMRGDVTVAIGDDVASRRRLQNAVLVYHLSPAQARLAELIVAGHDLVSAADHLGVTVNTARTQLHRMFEKAGVRSQPSLVTALLSVAASLESP